MTKYADAAADTLAEARTYANDNMTGQNKAGALVLIAKTYIDLDKLRPVEDGEPTKAEPDSGVDRSKSGPYWVDRVQTPVTEENVFEEFSASQLLDSGHENEIFQQISMARESAVGNYRTTPGVTWYESPMWPTRLILRDDKTRAIRAVIFRAGVGYFLWTLAKRGSRHDRYEVATRKPGLTLSGAMQMALNWESSPKQPVQEGDKIFGVPVEQDTTSTAKMSVIQAGTMRKLASHYALGIDKEYNSADQVIQHMLALASMMESKGVRI